jgi:hypothetical protein
MNFVKLCLENKGSIHPLILPNRDLKGPSLTNPSIYNDNGRIFVNLRNINYTLYHSEKKIYENQWGPLVYIHPENDLHLRTWNYMCELDENMRIKWYYKVDTSKFPDKELWDFVGLEDCRIVRWDGKFYLTGVRRDLDSIGTGRMELSEISITESGIREINQFRIPTPENKESYCEKNWMPILDMPFHYVKWTNGTEVIKTDPVSGTTETVVLQNWKDLGCSDLRGGSQVIPLDNVYHICLVHETDLLQSEAGRKDAVYRHRFIIWDQDWNVTKVSKLFSFMEASIEFAVGMCEYGEDYLMTFGYQDNAAYLLRVNQKVVKDFIFND